MDISDQAVANIWQGQPLTAGQELRQIMETEERMLIDFSNADEKENWRIINDDVMGGISQSEIVFGETGTAIFQGRISLENNGGFASTRSKPGSFNLDGYTGLVVRIQGDGKDYQLRIRTDNRFEGISY